MEPGMWKGTEHGTRYTTPSMSHPTFATRVANVVPGAFRRPLRKRVKRRLNALDKRLFRSVAAAHLPGCDRVLPRLSRAADNSLLWACVAAALASTGRDRLRRAATRGLLSISLVSPLVNLLGKQAFGRDRPSIADFPRARLGRVPASLSFPSGHSAAAAAFAAAVAMEAPARIAVPVAVTAGAVCFSRVYTGVHYPGDVLAGASLGVAAAIVTGRLWARRTAPSPASTHRTHDRGTSPVWCDLYDPGPDRPRAP
jgi:undecaprenyl-diphosphatase